MYFSALCPTLMNRLAAGPAYLIEWVARVMESLSCTCLTDECHDWYDNILEQEKNDDAHEFKRPRAADLPVPDAQIDFALFVMIAMMKAILTNWHVHSFTCEKTKKGRVMCRLALPRG
jgi:hypothetical protein